MLRPKRVWIGLGIFLVAVAIVFALRRTPKPRVIFDLADGSVLELGGVVHGTALRFYEGEDWQRPLFRLSHGKLPYFFEGTEFGFDTLKSNDCIGIEMRHYGKAKPFSSPINGSESLVVITPSGTEIRGNMRLVNFFVRDEWQAAKHSAEDICWEFPLSKEPELHFRFYLTNSPGNVSTNDFTVANLSFKPHR